MRGLTPYLAVWLVMLSMTVPVAAQAPLISSPASGTSGLDPDAPLTLAWTTVPDATTAYMVELSERASFDTLLPLKDAEVPAQAGRLGQNYAVQFTDDTTLRPGRTYFWRVGAQVDVKVASTAWRVRWASPARCCPWPIAGTPSQGTHETMRTTSRRLSTFKSRGDSPLVTPSSVVTTPRFSRE